MGEWNKTSQAGRKGGERAEGCARHPRMRSTHSWSRAPRPARRRPRAVIAAGGSRAGERHEAKRDRVRMRRRGRAAGRDRKKKRHKCADRCRPGERESGTVRGEGGGGREEGEKQKKQNGAAYGAGRDGAKGRRRRRADGRREKRRRCGYGRGDAGGERSACARDAAGDLRHAEGNARVKALEKRQRC